MISKQQKQITHRPSSHHHRILLKTEQSVEKVVKNNPALLAKKFRRLINLSQKNICIDTLDSINHDSKSKSKRQMKLVKNYSSGLFKNAKTISKEDSYINLPNASPSQKHIFSNLSTKRDKINPIVDALAAKSMEKFSQMNSSILAGQLQNGTIFKEIQKTSSHQEKIKLLIKKQKQEKLRIKERLKTQGQHQLINYFNTIEYQEKHQPYEMPPNSMRERSSHNLVQSKESKKQDKMAIKIVENEDNQKLQKTSIGPARPLSATKAQKSMVSRPKRRNFNQLSDTSKSLNNHSQIHPKESQQQLTQSQHLQKQIFLQKSKIQNQININNQKTDLIDEIQQLDSVKMIQLEKDKEIQSIIFNNNSYKYGKIKEEKKKLKSNATARLPKGQAYRLRESAPMSDIDIEEINLINKSINKQTIFPIQNQQNKEQITLKKEQVIQKSKQKEKSDKIIQNQTKSQKRIQLTKEQTQKISKNNASITNDFLKQYLKLIAAEINLFEEIGEIPGFLSVQSSILKPLPINWHLPAYLLSLYSYHIFTFYENVYDLASQRGLVPIKESDQFKQDNKIVKTIVDKVREAGLKRGKITQEDKHWEIGTDLIKGGNLQNIMKEMLFNNSENKNQLSQFGIHLFKLRRCVHQQIVIFMNNINLQQILLHRSASSFLIVNCAFRLLNCSLILYYHCDINANSKQKSSRQYWLMVNKISETQIYDKLIYEGYQRWIKAINTMFPQKKKK